MYRKNQHYVPQFYFRHFSGGGDAICVLLTRSGKIISPASIKHQCARHNFYGSKELEGELSKLEGRHAQALRAVIDVAWVKDAKQPNEEEFWWFFEAVLFKALLPIEWVISRG